MALSTTLIKLMFLVLTILAFLQKADEPLAKLQSCPQQSRLHRGHAQFQRRRGLLGRKSFHISQYEHGPEARGKALDRLAQNLTQLSLRVLLLGIWAPIRDLTRQRIIFRLDIFVE